MSNVSLAFYEDCNGSSCVWFDLKIDSQGKKMFEVACLASDSLIKNWSSFQNQMNETDTIYLNIIKNHAILKTVRYSRSS